MKDVLQKKVQGISDASKKYHLLREGLQHLVLKILDEEGFFKYVCFLGGTALRVVYDLRRFSEGIDFSLQIPQDPRFDFQKMLVALRNRLEVYGLPIDTKIKEVGAVRSVFLRFKDILQELDVVKRKGQKLAIKVEVDTNPPLSAGLESHLIQKDFLFTVIHHDLPTLCGGKLLAFLFRRYTKGRDLYDLIWFLTRKTPVNKVFLENGLLQATGHRLSWTLEDLLKKLDEKIESLEMDVVIQDAKPFLEEESEIRFLDKELLKPLVKNLSLV